MRAWKSARSVQKSQPLIEQTEESVLYYIDAVIDRGKAARCDAQASGDHGCDGDSLNDRR